MTASRSDETSALTPEAWRSMPDFSQRIRQFLASHQWDRARLSTILAHACTQAEAGNLAVAGARRLAQPTTAALVTGQQPAVGGGPLYTLVKAAHTIALAEQLDELGVNAVPVFWCASEDHDLGEAGHADLVLRSGDLHRFHGNLGIDTGRASLRFQPATAWWDGLTADCRQHLGPGLGAAWLEQHRPRGDEGLGAWLCRLLAGLFAGHGLVCVEAHHLRPLWRAQLEAALANWPRPALATLRARLIAEGHADAFGELAQPPLFADRSDGRHALNESEARALCLSDALSLSPGAALRPVLQQAALPCAAYLAGPSELRYHAFITPLYAALGVPAPQLVPRCSLTLVPAWVERGLKRWGASAEDCAAGVSAPTQMTTVFTTEIDALDAALMQLEIRQDGAPAHLRQRLSTGVAKLRRDRHALTESLARGERRAADKPAWGALAATLRPRASWQERGMSLFQAVWEHGPGLGEVLVAAARALPPAGHACVRLAGSSS